MFLRYLGAVTFSVLAIVSATASPDLPVPYLNPLLAVLGSSLKLSPWLSKHSSRSQ
jgi:hypothetical protein